jgi:salicylate hydroxylase
MTALVRPLPVSGNSQRDFHVIIVGGGIGGLTLAQGLKKAGISAAVYERDRTPTDRLQGYRVHIDPTGSRALHACLPSTLFGTFARTCGKRSRGIRFLTEDCDVLLSVSLSDMGVTSNDDIGQHRSVSRITLRQVLLSDLDNAVHFGKTFTRYEERPDGRVIAYFEDGTSAEGDFLVAADGGNSRVRRQLLPHAERLDTGVIGIAGKIFLDQATRLKIAPLLLDGLSLVSAKGGIGLFVALQELNIVEAPGKIGGNDDQAGADVHFDNTRSYLMWALSARRGVFGLNGDRGAIEGEKLRAVALRTMGAWSDRFKDLVRLSDPSTLSLITIRTSVPIAPWQTGRVTLIGDAIHSMTPYRGIGANIALKDAWRLRDAIVQVCRDKRELTEAVHDYETEMVRYGFAAVQNSRRAMEQTLSTNAARRSISRAALRVIDKLPPLKRRMFQSTGDD